MIDIHNHCKYSYDSVAEPKEMIELAVERGAKIYGFSDHVDLKIGKSVEAAISNTEACFAELSAYRHAYPSTVVLCGVEFDHRRSAVEEYANFVKKFDFDYVIQSVHDVGEKGERECFTGYFDGITVDEGYRMYFDAVEDSLNVPYRFHILGHLGFLFKCAKNMTSDEYLERYHDRITRILKRVIELDVALEVNTSVYKSPTFCVPDENVLRLYYELGGRKITIGSDAHGKERVMDRICEVLQLLGRIGFEYIYYFEKGQERRISLGDLLGTPCEKTGIPITATCKNIG